MKNQGSNFATLPGLVIFGVLILAAAYFNIPGLEALAIAVFLLCLLACLWARFALSRVELETEGVDCYGFPGEVLETRARLCNRKFLPVIWLNVCLPLPEYSCVEPLEENGPEGDGGEPPSLREDFLWVMPHQSIAWKQQARAVYRGVCRIRTAELLSGDGFGLADRCRVMELPAGFRFVVFPTIRPVRVSRILHSLRELEVAKSGIYEDNTLISNTRDYRDGDSVRNINWRLLARQGKVQVNVREKLDARRVCFLPNLESCSYTEEFVEDGKRVVRRKVRRDDMEQILSLIASLTVALEERGVLCTLAVPSIDDAPARLVIPQGLQSQTVELLTALAEIDYRGEETHIAAGELLDCYHELGQVFLFSLDLSRQPRELVESLEGVPLIHVVQTLREEAADPRHIIQGAELMAGDDW